MSLLLKAGSGARPRPLPRRQKAALFSRSFLLFLSPSHCSSSQRGCAGHPLFSPHSLFLSPAPLETRWPPVLRVCLTAVSYQSWSVGPPPPPPHLPRARKVFLTGRSVSARCVENCEQKSRNIVDFFFNSTYCFPSAVATSVIPSPPQNVPFIFIAQRVQHSNCSIVDFRRVFLYRMASSPRCSLVRQRRDDSRGRHHARHRGHQRHVLGFSGDGEGGRGHHENVADRRQGNKKNSFDEKSRSHS